MLFIWNLNMARRSFIFFDVVTKSEDCEGIPFSILPVADDLVFFTYHFETLQMDNASWYRIYQ